MHRWGGRILTSNPSPEDILLRLAKGLQYLLDIAQKGEWEKIDGQLDELLLTMDIVRSPDFPGQTIITHPELAEQILQFLNVAVDLCSARKDQIAPLVDALAKAPETQPKP